MVIRSGSGGWSSETDDQIAAALEMSKDDIVRKNMDMDIFDYARWLIVKCVDLDDRVAVEKALRLGPRYDDPRFVDAVLIAARNMFLEVEEWSPSQGGW
jgi:hypothetical protein